MSRKRSSDPLADYLKTSVRGNTAMLVAAIRQRLANAPAITLQLRNTLVLTLLIPAESLLRRMILTIAATMTPSQWQPRPKPERAPSPTGSRPAGPGPRSALLPAFCLTDPGAEKAPRRASSEAQAPLRPRTIPAPNPAVREEDRLLADIERRLATLAFALSDPGTEAIRFLRRYHALGAPRRAPLAFGRPPGLAPGLPGAVYKVLETADTEATTAWHRLCDAS